ncbi:DENN domain-containing protein 3-like isoform X2 [Anneissia japonica]|uniref:DENN domain-containing protein 3-like isoform X2 n=1 Tax=Anneissia japonica TaxID=1529436 RepID=UPI0014257537|nr:DENN domain-containing protein 3-like isoform X2 [Anneissia japonica]
MSQVNSEASASEETDSFSGYPLPCWFDERSSPSPRKLKLKMASTAAVPVVQPKLQNSLVEMCVLVGVDQDTGLKIKHFPQDSDMDPFESMDEVGPVDTQVLAVITGQSAYYPQSKDNQVDPNYPHIPTTPQRSPHKNLIRSSSRRLIRMMSSKGPIVPQPINHEMVNSLPPLCFPDEAYVISQSKHRLEETIHTLVLTSMTGVRSYATCLTFHVPYRIQKSKHSRESGCYDLDQCIETNTREIAIRYLPKCICLISQAPYFGVMKKVLSSLLPDLQQPEHVLLKSLKQMLYCVAMVPIPPHGNLSVEFSLNDMSIVVAPPDDPGKPVVDIALHIPFLSFNVKDTLQIVTFILMQQPIVFLASNYALLTHVMECFMVFILPFKWPFTYVPIVSSMLLDLLEAPGCFLMGCHSEHSQSVKQIEGIVVADIDRGSLHISDTIDVPQLPEYPVSVFMENFSSVRRYMVDLMMVGRPDPTTLESSNSFTDKMNRKFQLEIQNHFLEFMANLFRDVQDFISPELQFVKKDSFLESRLEEERDFYKKVIYKQLFKTFLDDRLNKKQDYYTRFERNTRYDRKNRPPSLPNISIFSDFPSGGRRLRVPSINSSLPVCSIAGKDGYRPSRALTANAMRRKSSATFEQVKQSHTPRTRLTLPSFEGTLDEGSLTAANFFKTCIEELTEKMNVQNQGIKASYLYLRGMLRIATSQFITGLDDLYNLNTADLSIMPIDFMANIVENLSPEDAAVVKKNPFFRSEEFLKKVERRNSLNYKRLLFKELDLENLPQKLDLNEFINRIQVMEIAIDIDVIEKLFEALTVGTDELLSETFSFFVDCWKENGNERDSIYPYLEAFLSPEEFPLKVSGLIRSDDGSGRLVLTQKRLLFLSDGNQKCNEVIYLKKIERLEKFDNFKSLIHVPALRIHSKTADKKPYTANLKAERNSWHTLVTEMWKGRLMSDAQKDDQVIMQAAQNVVLLDAVIRSAEIENAMHARHIESAAGILCYFTHSNWLKESPNALKHRINPSFAEPKRTTVEAMIYIPGNRSGGKISDEDSSPKLWCAMASGKVKVFDATTWMFETEFCDAKDRVCCLLSVGVDSVWAGSFDTNIYIIDVDTYTANQKLCDHSDYVSDMTVNADET